MSYRRGIRDPYSVSLFPFLAVLICTFGVLIILLVIVVKAADQHAQQSQRESQQIIEQQLQQAQLDLDLQAIRAEGFRSLRPELLRQLSVAKTERAHLQNQISQLDSEQNVLLHELEILKDQSQLVSTDVLTAKRAELQRQIEDERDLLAKKRDSLTSAVGATTYSVVPYDGPGGTRRRPVYIECRQDAITIQPYEIRLTREDFVAPILPNNPLDAALIAVREYYLKAKLNEPGMPYPLLIVRPDGAPAYALARQAMKSWDEEFGYELIAADVALDYGHKDSQLEPEMLLAVDAARIRQREFVVQQRLQRRAPTDQPVSPAGGLLASQQHGGFVTGNGRVVPAAAESSSTSPDEHRRANIRTVAEDASETANHAADISSRKLQSQPQSISESRGQNWALPSKSEGAIAFHRPVRVYLTQQAIVMDADSAANHRVDIPIDDGQPIRAIEDLVEAIWQRIESWGVAGVGGYWKPELDVVVLPGGEERYVQFESLLAGSGLSLVERKP